MAKKKSKHIKSTANTFYKGNLDISRSGMGYVVVEGLKQDILVKPSDFNRALHGDTVQIKILNEHFKTGRLQGKVEKVLHRKQTDFIGQIEVNREYGFFLPDRQKPMPDFFIPPAALQGAKDGDRVVVRMVEWKEGQKNPEGMVMTVLDSHNTNDLAMKDILVQNGFPLVFTEDLLEESLRIPDVIPSSEIALRKDMRGNLTFTIDPYDAKDFDDAISIYEVEKGMYEIGIHIADVAHYIHPDSLLDKEARSRATSVYLTDRVLPMLPEKISNELCSLRPHEDKLTFSCVFRINAKGSITETWIGKTIIHSNHRFTYEDVQKTIDSGEGLYASEISILNHLAQKFRKNRLKNGAINFSSQEIKFKLDETGRPIGIVVKEYGASHQLIEEFMLLANRTVAEYVHSETNKKSQQPFPYRVHDTPDQDKLVPFIEFARKFGHQFDMSSPVSVAASFNRMLESVKGQPEQHVLEQLGIRTMAKAVYSTSNIGHYGLGFKYYCHFTSPIRRYPDILVHRVLEKVLSGERYPESKLEQICRHCSEREKAAMEAERASNKYKQVEYMNQYVGEEFDAVISGVASFGFWAETIDHKCEGLVSILSLQDYDDFKFIEEDYRLVGRRGGRSFQMGDKVRIRVVSANLSRRQLDYEWILQPDYPLAKKSGRKKHG